MDQELGDAAAYAPGRRCVCTHQVVTLSGDWKVMIVILEYLHIV